jgi:hypothetical protein
MKEITARMLTARFNLLEISLTGNFPHLKICRRLNRNYINN